MSSTRSVEEWLDKIENDRNIYILYASEVGSRAYGLASPDSDNDVRFIFIGRSVDEYILEKVPDTITMFSEDKMYDFVGFELRKAIKLYRSGNCSLVELLSSKIIHRENQFVPRIIELKIDGLHVMDAYMSLSKGMRKQLNEERAEYGVSLKKYFYVIRTAAILQWYNERVGRVWLGGENNSLVFTTPPLDFQSLIGELKLSEEVKRALGELFLIKTTQPRDTRIKERVACIDEWIDGVIESFEPNRYSIKGLENLRSVYGEQKIVEDLILTTVHAYSPI